MSFLSVGFLFAALAAVIPVLLHMIHRQTVKELPFPSLRFLKISEQKTRRKRRFQDVLLLLLRMAILLLVAVALAHPIIRNLSQFWGGNQTAIVIVIDNSASMGQIDGESTRLEIAINSARQILEELNEGDQIAILVSCGPEFPESGRLSNNQDKTRGILGQIKVSYQKADIVAKLNLAKKILSQVDSASKMIFILGDDQRVSFAGFKPDEEKTEDAFPVVFVSCAAQPKPNVGLARLEMPEIAPVPGVPISMTVRLRNESPIPQNRRLEIYVGGVRQHGSPDIELAAETEVRYDFSVVFDKAGTQNGEVRLIGIDGSKYDDRQFFAIEVGQGIPVALVKPQSHEIAYLEETFYLEQALSMGSGGVSPFSLSFLTPENLLTEPLSGYSAVVCANLPALNTEAAQRLLQYVRGGGTILWTVGDNVDAIQYNMMNEQADGQLIPFPFSQPQTPETEDGKDSWFIGSLSENDPAFRNLQQPASLYRSVLVYKTIIPDLPQTEIATIPALIRLDGGWPLMVEKRVGTGRVVFFGTSLQLSWTNLPIRPIFVPMINQLMLSWSGMRQTRLRTVAGMPLEYRFLENDAAESIEIIPPTGGVIQIPIEDGRSIRFDETYQIGVYTIRPLGGIRRDTIPFSVNIDDDEIDPKIVTETELGKIFGEKSFVYIKAEDKKPLDLSMFKSGTSLWDMFIIFVLVILIVEALIANRLTLNRKSTVQSST